MNNNLSQQAINLALKGEWKKAAEVNDDILKLDPENIDALNRCARAYSELGDFEKARKKAEKVLKIDPFNSIATKSLAKWKNLSEKSPAVTKQIISQAFLEEPGKTKIISLINLGSPSLLATLDSGCEVKLNTHGHKIGICTIEGVHIGRLPDNFSNHIKMLIGNGYEYEVYIKYADPKEVKVFVKETKRNPKFFNTPSFSTDSSDQTYLT